ncbi:MAG: universal stress protein [Candidatus Schekmanbacteria bacterium]|nr:universal stress protein [Candidatus Schekmanbacteria bacterium]
MNRIMLVLSTTRQSKKTIEYAVEKANQEKAHIDLLFILDSNISNAVFTKIHEMDLLGEGPSEELQAIIMKEYRQRGYALIEEIEAKLKEKEVSYSVYVERGEFADEVLKKISTLSIELVILTRARRSNIARMIFGSAVDRIIDEAPCKVEVIDEN